MSRLRHIAELAVDREFYDWCNSPEGRKYWEDYAKRTKCMNAYQYAMFINEELWVTGMAIIPLEN